MLTAIRSWGRDYRRVRRAGGETDLLLKTSPGVFGWATTTSRNKGNFERGSLCRDNNNTGATPDRHPVTTTAETEDSNIKGKT